MAAMEGDLGLSYDEDEDFAGLACPPFDEAAVEMVQNSAMDFSGFFNEFNDDGFLPYKKERKGKNLERDLKVFKKIEAESTRIRAQLPLLKQKNSITCVIKNREKESMQMKFESTKRKLHDSYKKIENEKKRRKIHVIEFRNLPKSKSKSTQMQRYSSLFQKMKNYHAKLYPKKFRPIVY